MSVPSSFYTCYATDKREVICFTPRCSVPVVLRKMENESWRYQVIGTCYVCDYMSGQISNLLFKKKLSTIEFAVPFGADKSTSKAASMTARIVNNDPTQEVLDLAQDSRTHTSKASKTPSMVREVDVPQSARGFRMYWICVSKVSRNHPGASSGRGCNITASMCSHVVLSIAQLVSRYHYIWLVSQAMLTSKLSLLAMKNEYSQ